ncbi:MAG: Quinolinate synthase A [Candidatus Methanolliviera sp. GoM_asphalt]|nr:MAG: Quinolinate synthase A [Candidatus Methanolliviera sp. GoM_asphalt]
MIEKLKDKKNAIILAHNYSRPEIQDVADFVGDSLELAEKASKTDAEIIVFCGVDFMAETAAILNPDKKVLIPDIAICPMAQMLKTEDMLKAKKRYPDAEVVLYINTLAEHKVYADCICTSANASHIVESMNSDTVIFGPDINLARYVESQTSKRVIPVPEYGLCPTHHQITAEDLLDAKARHPGVEIVAHPECTEEILKKADAIASTSGMIKYCKESEKKEFLIATEIGLIHRLRKDVPGKKFYPVSKSAVCPQMKTHTLRKIERALEVEKIHVKVSKETAEKAMIPIERMLSIRKG